ncbi:peptide ABC transporter substrate-binding protein [Fibrobacterales bacterium]|nr:peptide ABC transporter substrate-binding protein [Fibrobacterales bacterium]
MNFSKLALCGALALSFTLISCEKSGTETAKTSSGYPRGETLYLAGSQWGDPNTFNPLVEPWLVAWPANDRFNLMYEPLTAYNSLTGATEPILATLISSDAEKVVVDIQPEAKWSDGTPVTSTDVKFIYELWKRFPQAPTSYVSEFVSEITVDTISNNGVNTERVSFFVNKKARNNPLAILDQLQAIRIVPSHIFEKYLAENNNDFNAVKKIKCDSVPVVSGPYTLAQYNNERIVLVRRDDYWGNKVLHDGALPVPKYIIHPIYKNNDHFAINLQKGALDASMNYIPRISEKKKDGVNTWYDAPPYFVPGSMHFLYLNNTKAPLSDKNFRRAIAAAIDYQAISRLALSNYTPEQKPGLIMSDGLEKKFYNADSVAAHSVPLGDKEYAKKLLEESGYKAIFDEKGSLVKTLGPKGDTLPSLSIKSPAGWSDWEAIVNLVVRQLRSVGIDVREGFVDGSQYWPALPSGDFDLIMRKPPVAVTASLPWNRFNAIMSSRNWSPVGDGNSMNENEGRYNSPKAHNYNKRVDILLDEIPLITDEEKLKAAYTELNNIFLDDQPVIPVAHLPEEYYQFSSKAWQGWPTEKNPFAPPQLPWVGSGINTLWKLKPVK